MSAVQRTRAERPGGRLAPGSAGLIASWGGAGGSSPRLQVAEIQRSRLFAATVTAVEEHGYSNVTVAHILNRARISRRTFYELHENLDACLTTTLEDALGLVTNELAIAELDGLPWRERVRQGLWRILSFFDREPAVARLCVVQSLRADENVLERRAEVVASLARVIDEGRGEASRDEIPPLTADGLVGAVHSIVYANLLKREREPLTSLFGSLMSMIVLPYLGQAAARHERSCPAPGLRAVSTNGPGDVLGRVRAGSDPLQGLPMRLTYRTVCVLQAIANHPGISNRTAGEHAGVSDQGQISKLLARLERLGLLTNTGEGHVKGAPNVWRLTPTGEQVAQSIGTQTVSDAHWGTGEAAV